MSDFITEENGLHKQKENYLASETRLVYANVAGESVSCQNC